MTRKTDGGKGDRIPGANPSAYEAGYAGIQWGDGVDGTAVHDGHGSTVVEPVCVNEIMQLDPVHVVPLPESMAKRIRALRDRAERNES